MHIARDILLARRSLLLVYDQRPGSLWTVLDGIENDVKVLTSLMSPCNIAYGYSGVNFQWQATRWAGYIIVARVRPLTLTLTWRTRGHVSGHGKSRVKDEALYMVTISTMACGGFSIHVMMIFIVPFNLAIDTVRASACASRGIIINQSDKILIYRSLRFTIIIPNNSIPGWIDLVLAQVGHSKWRSRSKLNDNLRGMTSIRPIYIVISWTNPLIWDT